MCSSSPLVVWARAADTDSGAHQQSPNLTGSGYHTTLQTNEFIKPDSTPARQVLLNQVSSDKHYFSIEMVPLTGRKYDLEKSQGL